LKNHDRAQNAATLGHQPLGQDDRAHSHQYHFTPSVQNYVSPCFWGMSTISPGQYIPVDDVCFPRQNSKLKSSNCYASWEIDVKQDRQYKYSRSIEARSCKHCCTGKTI